MPLLINLNGVSKMKKKSDVVRELVANKQLDKALSLAKTFRMWHSKEDGRAVKLAHEVKTNPIPHRIDDLETFQISDALAGNYSTSHR